MIITTRDVFTIPGHSARRGFCRRGARAWFRAHQLDWAAFVRDGMDEADVLAIGDAFALAVVQWAHERAAREVC